jgi:hypothetical protein
VPAGYDVRVGPLSFIAPVDNVGESVGDGLDVVGASLAAAERKPRPLKLKLPVRGYDLEAEPREAGLRLRRQLRQMMDNARFRLQGIYLTWSIDPDLDCWLMIGGAELSETDPGVGFGEFVLELSEVYIVGRPGTHRPGRRIAVADRRTGLVPRDTRGRLYSTDFAIVGGTPSAYLPGDATDFVSSVPGGLSTLQSAARGGRHLYSYMNAEHDGEVVTYRPAAVLTGRTNYLDLDDFGSVRVWDQSRATTYPLLASEYTVAGDEDPQANYGWEQVLGDVLTPDKPLAMDNGECRVVWLGAAAAQGLAVEHWDTTAKKFVRDGRVLHSLNVAEQRVVECTPERAVLEWRAGTAILRAILQRGWTGPRIEAYNDAGGNARLEFSPEVGTGSVTNAAGTPTWLKQIKRATSGKIYYWAQGSADETTGVSPTIISGGGATFQRSGVIVAQLGWAGTESIQFAALWDVRSIPILVGR